MLDKVRDEEKHWKKRKKTGTLEKLKPTLIFFTFTFLYKKIDILLENMFGETYFLLLYLH